MQVSAKEDPFAINMAVMKQLNKQASGSSAFLLGHAID
jgi:hypothetical protein